MDAVYGPVYSTVIFVSCWHGTILANKWLQGLGGSKGKIVKKNRRFDILLSHSQLRLRSILPAECREKYEL
jgi:hypothetical protein